MTFERPGGLPIRNIDELTVTGFGDEWGSFDQTNLVGTEWRKLFERYFAIFPWHELPEGAEGFDLGCGSGRWASGVAPKVTTLNCIDPSQKALAVCRRRLAEQTNVRFYNVGTETLPFDDESQDFGYSLGVLHHIPDTQAAMNDCVRKLKLGAPFLVYLYYAFENRPAWFRAIWRISDLSRQAICRLPFALRKAVTTVIAAMVYWPLAKAASLIETLGFD